MRLGYVAGLLALIPFSTASAEIDIEQRIFEVADGRKLYMECAGVGEPAVLLIGGLRAGADYWNRNAEGEASVFRRVAQFTRVCSYERPGTVWGNNQFSRSDAIVQPTTQAPAVSDLRDLITASGETGPYVLAAHSYGGFIARSFAGLYPEDVVGLVLVDALSEGFEAALSEEQFAAWKATTAVPDEDIALYPGIERLDFDAVMQQMRESAPLTEMPLVVLSADRRYGAEWEGMIESGALPPDTPVDLGYAIDAAQQASQSFQANLLDGAKHITETHSGHDIPHENTGLVVETIRGIVAK
ncbi:alpha/beta hydrolase [Devosia sp. WQ 349]|uniref:alpha/beta fold hydrolase n=1 Tax=Devosia sp. WQ 349K1 TaxID=2800329 RepID=UPI001905411F|nr:alpha/beta hydrolase [Devosia sp. WQ 349K1]MBK1793256.1 alpha/beta hydrolase [Devosia sp. WQ 349K1]